MTHRLSAIVLLCLGLAACSGTTFRHDTYRAVTIDGREMFVSWIWLNDEELDLAVFEEPPLDPGDAPPWIGREPAKPPVYRAPTPLLNARMAREAALSVAQDKCSYWGRGKVRLGAEAAFGGGRRYAYRAACQSAS